MRTIRRRVEVLEERRAEQGYSDWTDEELLARMAELTEQITDALAGLEARGASLPNNWRGVLERGDWRALEGLTCAI